MAVREVIRMGHPTLRKKAELVKPDEINTPEFKQLIADMFETMKAYDGVGLAAPQINISKQLAIVGIPEDNPRYPDQESTKQYIVINPRIKILDTKKMGFWEGCLSVPGMRGLVERPRKIQLDFLNEQGQAEKLVLEGFPAVVFQHELDHLEGTLYIDRIRDTKNLAFNEEYSKFIAKEDEEEID